MKNRGGIEYDVVVVVDFVEEIFKVLVGFDGFDYVEGYDYVV